MKNRRGFTLVELVIVIIIIGFLAVVAVPRFVDFTGKSREGVTKQKLSVVRIAIIGNPDVRSASTSIDRGYIADVGHVPPNLNSLVDQTYDPSAAAWNKYNQIGWNGPYMNDVVDGDFMYDGWDRVFQYDSGTRTIRSAGPNGTYGDGDDIVVTF